jgi:hypothetical protein
LSQSLVRCTSIFIDWIYKKKEIKKPPDGSLEVSKKIELVVGKGIRE